MLVQSSNTEEDHSSNDDNDEDQYDNENDIFFPGLAL